MADVANMMYLLGFTKTLVGTVYGHGHSDETHYSVAQIDELVAALNLITDERSRTNRSLEMIRREGKLGTSPQKVPMKRKMG